MKLTELLEVHAVSGLMQVQYRDNQSWTRRIAPHTAGGLDVFCGRLRLPWTIMRPRRVMSRPTEIMFVARATSTGSAPFSLEQTANAGAQKSARFSSLLEVRKGLWSLYLDKPLV
jgi:hypothetical protein